MYQISFAGVAKCISLVLNKLFIISLVLLIGTKYTANMTNRHPNKKASPLTAMIVSLKRISLLGICHVVRNY